jgi:ketopantoate reductase
VTPPTRCLVWGAGAIGGTMGAYLARAGHDVTLVDTVAEHVAAIHRSGLSITGPIATFTTPLPAFTPDALRGEWDTIILATKAQHTAAAEAEQKKLLAAREHAVAQVAEIRAEFDRQIATHGDQNTQAQTQFTALAGQQKEQIEALAEQRAALIVERDAAVAQFAALTETHRQHLAAGHRRSGPNLRALHLEQPIAEWRH